MAYEVKENMYGHLKRLRWMCAKLSPGVRICEVGCGTGVMISLPLAQKGFQVIGIDTDAKSIEFGKAVIANENIAAELFTDQDCPENLAKFDVVIVSEVLEHISDAEYPEFFRFVQSRMKEGGKLLVTVPNGYGWFELESYLYFKKRIGKAFEALHIHHHLDRMKNFFLGNDWVNTLPSTLSHTPHVQRFTFRSIQRLLKLYGFSVCEVTGSVLFAGPFTDWFFTGVNPVMRCNNFLGRVFPWIASGFFVESTWNGSHE